MDKMNMRLPKKGMSELFLRKKETPTRVWLVVRESPLGANLGC